MSIASQAAAASADSRPVFSFRHCMGQFATGVTVVTYAGDDGPHGVTVNSFTSVSLDPPLILVCLDRRSKAIPYVRAGGFAVNVLHAQQQHLAWHFGGRPSGDVAAPWSGKADATPLLNDSLAWMTCTPWVSHEAGDHLIVVGKVTDFSINEHRPLCFFRGEFVSVPTHVHPPQTV